MKINNINNSVNFKGVYLVASKDNQLNKLKSQLDAYNGFYRCIGVSPRNFDNQIYNEKMQKAKAEGKSIDVFVTGADDCTKMLMNKKGWNTVKDLVNRAEIFFDLSDDDFYCVSNSLNYDA